MSGKTRTFFVGDELWDLIGAAAGRAGVSRSRWLVDVASAALWAEENRRVDGLAGVPVVADDRVPRGVVVPDVRPFSKVDQARGKR